MNEFPIKQHNTTFTNAQAKTTTAAKKKQPHFDAEHDERTHGFTLVRIPYHSDGRTTTNMYDK